MKPDPLPRAPVAGDRHQPQPDSREWLSALADGEAQALDIACAQWRADPQARREWHAYHLIGDVMRSDELARRPAHDAAFLAVLRERLAQEPAVLAPGALPPAAAAARPAWTIPVAVAAGFVVVAGALVVARMGAMTAPAPASVEMAVANEASGIALQVRSTADRQAVIVDPRLEEFLRVHQASGGGMSGVTPGGALRRVDIVVPVSADR